MLNHEIDLKSGCVYLCRVEDGYDPWKAIAKNFSTYDVFDIKVDFYQMFKAAISNLYGETSLSHIEKLTFGYEHFNDLIEALYFVGVDKGVVALPSDTVRPVFPRKWVAKHGTPEECVACLDGMYEPYEMRDYLWDIFQNSLSQDGPKASQKKRKQMIRLFEYLTDLATAAYVIAREMKGGNS